MKNTIIIIISIVMVLSLTVGVVAFLSNSNKTSTDTTESGRAIFEYDDLKISENLSDEDLNIIRKMFDNKKLYKDNPSCGFSENIAVVLDKSEVFCIACDECPIIYYKNKGMFFKLSAQENKIFRSILTKYGFFFPCI